MRLAIVSSAFPPFLSPETEHTRFLCTQLAERGLDVHLITSTSSKASDQWPFTVHAVMPGWTWRHLPRLTRTLRRIDPDTILLLHVGWIYQFHPMVTFLPTVTRRLLHSADFVTLFENVQVKLTRWSKTFDAFLHVVPHSLRFSSLLGTLCTSDRIIVLTASHLEAIADIDARIRAKATIIPAPSLMEIKRDDDGVVRATCRHRLGISESAFVVAFFGFIYESKGVETLYRAIGALPRDADVKLLLIGPIPEGYYADSLAQLANELAIEHRIVRTGHTEEVSGFLRASDLAVFPFDGGVQLNNSSFAAAAGHELPVITTRGSQLEPEFRHANNVWLCPPKDPQALAEGIEVLRKDQELRRKLAAGVLHLYQERFQPTRAIDATVAVLTEGKQPQ